MQIDCITDPEKMFQVPKRSHSGDKKLLLARATFIFIGFIYINRQTDIKLGLKKQKIEIPIWCW